MSTKKMQIIGLKGKSAYQYAQDGGYTGTEAEFKEKMANELEVVYDYEDLNEAILATAIKPETSGEFIHITDSAALPIMNFGMEGKTQQETTSGIQLIPPEAIKKATYNLTAFRTIGYLLEANQTYMVVTSVNADSLSFKDVSNNDNLSIVTGKNNVSYTPTEDKLVFVDCYFANGVPDNVEFMLYKGSTILPIEPYTGAQQSPNPNYPQEIINAGTYNETTGRYEIGCMFVNKNFWDVEYASDVNNWVASTAQGGYSEIPVYVGANKKISISYKNTLSTGLGIYAGVVVAENYSISVWLYNTASASQINKSCKITSTGDYIWVRCFSSKVYDGTFMQYIGNDLQIEIADAPTDLVSHASQHFTLTSPVPITKWDKLVKRDGVWGWSILSKEYEITGRETFNSGGDTYYTGSSTNMYLRLDDITSLANLNTQYIYCNELSFIKSIWDKTDGSVGMITNGEQLHLRLPNKLLGVSDDSARNDKIVAHRVYLEQRYDAGNPLKLLYKVDTEQSFHPLPDSEQALLKSVETYYQVTNIYNDQNCPMSIQYVADTQTYIDNLTTSLTNAVVSLGGEV